MILNMKINKTKREKMGTTSKLRKNDKLEKGEVIYLKKKQKKAEEL